jgi:hypothetical protein
MKTLSTLFLSASMMVSGCNGFGGLFQRAGQDDNNASFYLNYLIFSEENGSFIFRDEEIFLGGQLQLRFLLGNDPQRDGVLDDEDVIVDVLSSGEYPQHDAEDDGQYTIDYGFVDTDGDGINEAPEGVTDVDLPGLLTDSAYNVNPPGVRDSALVGGSIPLGEYDLFAIEVLDGEGNPVLWKDAPDGTLAHRIAYDPCHAMAGIDDEGCPGGEKFTLDIVTTVLFGINYEYLGLNNQVISTSEVRIYLPSDVVK